jgi:phenylacetate-coenzyme A ligase PaaK-like adenylate-forming protein
MGTVLDSVRLAQVAASVVALNQGSTAALQRVQEQRLQVLLASARTGSRLYRERLKGLPDDERALTQLAPVERGELMQRFDHWVCDPALDLAALQAFTADPGRIGEPFLGRYLVWESSGTSGSPGIFVQDAAAMAVYDALETFRRRPETGWRRLMDPMGLTERLAFVGATSGHFASQVTIDRLARLQPWRASSIRSFSILQPMDRLVEALNTFAPTIIASYPTAALVLAEQAQRGALQIPLREVWTGGETLGKGARQRIEQAFGAELRNSYGASEFLAMGWECGHGRLHLNTDWLLLEPVDEQGRAVPPGHVSHSVLLTNLANHVQPLIRYALGDRVSVCADPCDCGCPLPTIEVVGRHDDILRLRARKGPLVALLPLALSTVLEEDAGVFDFQIVQRDDHTLVVRLPSQGSEGRATLARCRSALQGFARQQGAAPLTVVGELGQAVPRGRSGKACRVQAKRG